MVGEEGAVKIMKPLIAGEDANRQGESPYLIPLTSLKKDAASSGGTVMIYTPVLSSNPALIDVLGKILMFRW